MAATTQRQNQQFSNNQRAAQNGGWQQPDNPISNGNNPDGANHNNANHSHANPSGPVESFRLNSVSISIFENEAENNGQVNRYFRAKIDKRYRDQKTGDWKSTSSFSLDELLRLGHLIDRAVEYMAAKPGE